MDRFTVPQFIDVEDKIVGPITTRQFVIMMIAFFAVTATYSLADFSLFLVLAVVEIMTGVVLGFLKVNGRPFHYFILNVIQTMKRPGIRIWKKEKNLRSTDDAAHTLQTTNVTPANELKHFPSPQTLKHLALIVDTGGKYAGDE